MTETYQILFLFYILLRLCPGSTHTCTQGDRKYLFWDGSCLSDCNLPNFSRKEGNLYFCDACHPSYFLYPNNTCLPYCNYPMRPRLENHSYFCDNPCLKTEFMYPNGSCISNCKSSYYITEIHGSKLCRPSGELPFLAKDHHNFKAYTLNQKPTYLHSRLLEGAPEYISKIGRDVSDVFITIASTLGSSNPATFTLAGFVKMVPYLRYVNIAYPPRLEAVLENLNSSLISFAFGPSIPASMQDLFPKHEIPWKFERYGLHSSFFVNYWQTMTSLGIILGVIIILCVLFRVTKKFELLNHVLDKLKLIVKWNFFLILFCTNLDGVALYTSLEMRSLHLDSVSTIFSLIFCIFVNLFALCVFGLIVIIVLDLRKKKAQVSPEFGDPSLKWRDFQLLFKGSKDDSFIQHFFLFPFLARIYIFNLAIAYLFEYPMIQASIIPALNIIMILYMLIKKPFVSKVVHYQHVSDEFLLLSVNISIFVMALLDKIKTEATESRATLGDFILVVNIMMSFSSLFFLAIYIFLGVQAAYQAIKVHKAKGILSILLILLAPFEAGGMDMELVPSTAPALSPRCEEGKKLGVQNYDSIIEERQPQTLSHTRNPSTSLSVSKDLSERRFLSPTSRTTNPIEATPSSRGSFALESPPQIEIRSRGLARIRKLRDGMKPS